MRLYFAACLVRSLVVAHLNRIAQAPALQVDEASKPESPRMTNSALSRARKLLFAFSAAVLFGGFVTNVGATVYDDDERLLPEARLTAREVTLYGYTQMVVCQSPGSENHGAAGTIATDFMHGVTVAHVFYDMRLQRLHTPDECKLRVYDGAGNGLQLIGIARIHTLWDHEPRMLKNDLAMFELAERPNYIPSYYSLPEAPPPLNEGEGILVVAYHNDLQPAHTKRKTRGRVYSTLGTIDEGVPNIFHTDADWTHLSSGGPIFSLSGNLVALAQGNTSPLGNTSRRRFDPKKDFNRAIRLDSRFLREYAEFVKGRRP